MVASRVFLTWRNTARQKTLLPQNTFGTSKSFSTLYFFHVKSIGGGQDKDDHSYYTEVESEASELAGVTTHIARSEVILLIASAEENLGGYCDEQGTWVSKYVSLFRIIWPQTSSFYGRQVC